MPEPVHIWCFLDRQHTGRVTARNIATIQPEEEWWTAFDFNDLLRRQQSIVDNVLWVNDPASLIDETSGYPIEGNLVFVKIIVPPNATIGYHGVEVHFQDSKNNRFTGSALLFVTEGTI